MKALLLCAKCNRKMGDTETFDGEPSHGFCLQCLDTLFPELYQAVTPTAQVPNDPQPATAHSEPIDAR